MKGTPQFPQCGFSATAAKTLASTGVEFAYVNIFEDQEVFQNLLTGKFIRGFLHSGF
jgi:monothiol glutaredoxin